MTIQEMMARQREQAAQKMATDPAYAKQAQEQQIARVMESASRTGDSRVPLVSGETLSIHRTPAGTIEVKRENVSTGHDVIRTNDPKLVESRVREWVTGESSGEEPRVPAGSPEGGQWTK